MYKEQTISTVLAYGDLNKLPHWKVYYGVDAKLQNVAGNSEVMCAHIPGELTWENSRPVLSNVLNMLPEGRYIIHFKADPTSTKKECMHVFDIAFNPYASPGIHGAPFQMQQALPQPQPQLTQDYIQAAIKGAVAEVEARFVKENYERQINELKAKLKEKIKNSGSGNITELIREARQTFVMLKQMDAPATTQIGIAGAESKTVGEQNKQAEQEQQQQTQVDPKLVELQRETLTELANKWGSIEDMIINLYCLKEVMNDKEEMFNAFIMPEMAKHKKVLYEMGIIADE